MIKLLENYYDVVVKQLRNINEENSLFSILLKVGQGSKQDQIFYFTTFWYHIPEKYLYQEYKSAFAMMELGNSYTKFFHPQLIERIMKLNKEDTVHNPELLKQVDEDGYLTVYHGHCKPTLRYANSWTTNKEIAKWFGNRNAIFSRHRSETPSDSYYVVTGKVKLEDVIAYIPDRNESEIVVQVKNVKDKSKEFYPYEME